MERKLHVEAVDVFKKLLTGEADGIKAYGVFDHFVNCFNKTDRKEFLKLMSEQSPDTQYEFSRACFNFIQLMNLNHKNKWVDARNEFACNLSNKIVDVIGKECEGLGMDKWEVGKFIDKMSTNHRYLQSEFAELCFYWLGHKSKESSGAFGQVLKDIAEKLGDEFYIYQHA